MKTNKKAQIKKNKAKVKFIKKSQGRKPPIPQNQVIPNKSRKKIRKNKFNNEIRELLREEKEEEIGWLSRSDGERDGSGYLM